jgi:hypothetical protein
LAQRPTRWIPFRALTQNRRFGGEFGLDVRVMKKVIGQLEGELRVDRRTKNLACEIECEI